MGNNASRSTAATAGSSRREPRRRDSIQALGAPKATPLPPSESLASATAHSTAQQRSTNQNYSRSRASTAKPIDHPTVDAATHQLDQMSLGGEQTQPVSVPSSATTQSAEGALMIGHQAVTPGSLPSGPPQISHYYPASQTQRPPRLPLPIVEEIHTPGSPVLLPTGATSSTFLDHDAVAGALPRRSSVISSNALDDDDMGDELQAYGTENPRKKIPTKIEWKRGGHRVYVTGTFVAWNRKFRLYRNPSTGSLSAIIQLPPGTHHLKFIVDGDMRTSDDLPTAVDFTNILVNYIEVSLDDHPDSNEGKSKPIKIPVEKEEPPPGIFPPQVLPESFRARRQSSGSIGKNLSERPKKYSSEIPQYLLDLDLPEGSAEYKRAAAAIGTLPPPPSLPMFLGKSLLNGNTPMKDDSSVLNMPNHTVLNHLTTSSIKNGVLGVSSTTRYGRKYVTTIMYRPATNMV
ncbi:MAG: hypothetical protein M1829_001740 [Trizodia sp. TS-e1964]|nr:MAG: hypothetical protein M1829_001740 [Trizodia sp. TS-e1964]